jgi:hypothetical protein
MVTSSGPDGLSAGALAADNSGRDRPYDSPDPPEPADPPDTAAPSSVDPASSSCPPEPADSVE